MPSLDAICLFFATLGPVGRIPKAPGTWGSAVAVLLAPLVFVALSGFGRVVLLLALFFVGALAASRAEQVLGTKDPGQVVIDEVLGQWVVFLPLAAPTTFELAAGFALFRLCDIAKPQPVRAAEHWLPDGYGVMLDDLLAGIYAMLGLLLLHWLR